MVRAIDIKYYALEPLNEIVGNSKMTTGKITQKVWKYIDKKNLKGVSGDTCKYKTKAGKTNTAKGGQVIWCGDDPLMKELCGGKKKIAMMKLPGIIHKHLERVD